MRAIFDYKINSLCINKRIIILNEIRGIYLEHGLYLIQCVNASLLRNTRHVDFFDGVHLPLQESTASARLAASRHH